MCSEGAGTELETKMEMLPTPAGTICGRRPWNPCGGPRNPLLGRPILGGISKQQQRGWGGWRVLAALF